MKDRPRQNKIVVIGGGPAGMMAAIRAAQLKQDVTLIEKNRMLGRKLLLTGKGRCNLTNACDLDPFLERFSNKGQFLRDSFKKMFNKELMDFFEKRGLKLRTERQLRVFPETDRSSSILEVLKEELCASGVNVINNTHVKDVIIEDNKVKGVKLTGSKTIHCDKVTLATGGISFKFTGSTGDGWKIAEKLGHDIISPYPGLVPLDVKQKYPGQIEGLSLRNIRLNFSDGRKQIPSEIGEMIFTGTGVSGPLVLTLSGRVGDWLKKNKNIHIEIDLKPALSREQLNARLLREFKSSPGKAVKNTLKTILPQRLIAVFMDITGIDPDKKVSQVTREERDNIAVVLKSLRLDITKPRPMDEAMISRGGVSLKQIDPRTMGSRIIKDLYFAGEMIDVDADTGGFNLQAAFSTGYLAGESAASS